MKIPLWYQKWPSSSSSQLINPKMASQPKPKQGLGDTYLFLSVESLSASSEYMERM